MSTSPSPESYHISWVRLTINRRSCATLRLMADALIRGEVAVAQRAAQWCRICQWPEEATQN